MFASKKGVGSFASRHTRRFSPNVPLALASRQQLINLITKPKISAAVKSELLNQRTNRNSWRVHELAKLAETNISQDPEILNFITETARTLPLSALLDAQISDMFTLFNYTDGLEGEAWISALRHHHHLLTREELEQIRARAKRRASV
jgi:hypothetical protein